MTHLFHIMSPVRYCLSIGFQEQISVHCRQGKTTISHHWLVSWHLVHILVHAIIQSTVWKWTLKYAWGRRWFKYLKRRMKSWFIWSDYIFFSAKINFLNGKRWEDYQQVWDFLRFHGQSVQHTTYILGIKPILKFYSSFKYIQWISSQ